MLGNKAAFSYMKLSVALLVNKQICSIRHIKLTKPVEQTKARSSTDLQIMDQPDSALVALVISLIASSSDSSSNKPTTELARS